MSLGHELVDNVTDSINTLTATVAAARLMQQLERGEFDMDRAMIDAKKMVADSLRQVANKFDPPPAFVPAAPQSVHHER